MREQNNKHLTKKMVHRLKISETMRICLTDYNYDGWKDAMMSKHMQGMKPNGMWYSVGKSWLKWCQNEEFGGCCRYIDMIDVDAKKILEIRNLTEFDAFEKQYQISLPGNYAINHMQIIDWPKVKEKYGGIEIAPYQWERRFDSLWYYGFDVASGCIWDRSTLLSRQRIYEFDARRNCYCKRL